MTAAFLAATPVPSRGGVCLLLGEAADGLRDDLPGIWVTAHHHGQRRGDDRSLVEDRGHAQQGACDRLLTRWDVLVIREDLVRLREKLIGSLVHSVLLPPPAVFVTRDGGTENTPDESAPGGCSNSHAGAQDPYPSWKAGPMNIMPHIPACLRHRPVTRSGRLAAELAALRAELAEARAGLDTLDLGVIDADIEASRANARVDEVFNAMRKLTGEVRDQYSDDPGSTLEALVAGITGPGKEPAAGEICDGIRADGLPLDHPESMALELSPAHEVMLVAYANDMWPGDEYTEIVAEDYRQRNGGTS